MNHCLVTGGSGFIGQALCPRLLLAGYRVTVLSRDPVAARRRLPPGVELVASLDQLDAMPGVDAVVNLAGEPLAGRRWTARRKALFHASRVDFTAHLREFFSARGRAPRVLVNGSAIGWYGPQGDELLDESSAPVDSFSHRLCAAWEEQAARFEDLGSRVCALRIGVVLDRGGGALASLLPLFRVGLGGPIGNGRQYLSWIHRQDLVSLILHALDNDGLRGPCNGTAPQPVTSREFARTLGKVLRRPAVLPTPAWAMRTVFGEMADELLISGQRVYPARALDTGFEFSHGQLQEALHAILKR